MQKSRRLTQFKVGAGVRAVVHPTSRSERVVVVSSVSGVLVYWHSLLKTGGWGLSDSSLARISILSVYIIYIMLYDTARPYGGELCVSSRELLLLRGMEVVVMWLFISDHGALGAGFHAAAPAYEQVARLTGAHGYRRVAVPELRVALALKVAASRFGPGHPIASRRSKLEETSGPSTFQAHQRADRRLRTEA